jgi:hypothetical protein
MAGDVLRDLGGARRRNRLTGIHWADAMYRVYILAVGVGGIAWWVATMFGSRRIKETQYLAFENRASQVVGLVIACVVLLATRSGLRGGPLAIESAELTHVLMSPVDRRRSLTHSIVQQYRRGAYLGMITGAIAGRLMVPFVVGNRVVWTLTGAFVGALTGLLWMGVAMNVSGRHLAKWWQLLGGGLMVGSAFDLRADEVQSPLSRLGRAFWFPLRNWQGSGVRLLPGVSPWAKLHEPPLAAALLAIFAVVVAALGLQGCAGLRIEHAERRAALVSQLRFAVTTQDLRSVLLLRRQLGSEHLRNRPRFRIKGRPGPEAAVVVRGVRSVARWPTSRFVRIAIMAILSGIAARLAYEGTLPLVAVPGLLAFVAGLDAIEALSQDADHPGLLASYPRHRGRLANRQIIVPAGVLAVAGLLGAIAGWLAGPIAHGGFPVGVLGFGVLLGLAWGALGAIAAAVSVAIGPPSMMLMLQTPEMAFARSLAAPGVAALGMIVPLLLAHNAASHHHPAGPPFIRGVILTVFVTYTALTILTSGGIREPAT